MRAELVPSQRRLVGLRLCLADGEVRTKYVFPLADRDWSVPFYIVDSMGRGPGIFEGALELRAGALYAKEPLSKLVEISAVPLARFEELVHFDPWWAFRGISGAKRDSIQAILASNVAGSFNHEGSTYKLHDLEFDSELRNLTAVVAKDPLFRTVTFRRGGLDLLLLRKPTRT